MSGRRFRVADESKVKELLTKGGIYRGNGGYEEKIVGKAMTKDEASKLKDELRDKYKEEKKREAKELREWMKNQK